MKVLCVPFSAGGLGKTKGCEMAPEKIVSLLGVKADYIPVDNLDIESSHDMIEKTVFSLDGPAVLIGGDHSITFPSVKGFAKERFTLVVLDAHPDLMDDFVPPTHEDYLRALIERVEYIDEVILLGARKIEPLEKEYIDRKRIKCYSEMDNIREVLRGLMCPVYLSIDIDCIDPIYAPGTGYREKDGFTPDEVLEIIGILKDRIRMADLVEVNPEKDYDDKTSVIASRLIRSLI